MPIDHEGPEPRPRLILDITPENSAELAIILDAVPAGSIVIAPRRARYRLYANLNPEFAVRIVHASNESIGAAPRDRITLRLYDVCTETDCHVREIYDGGWCPTCQRCEEHCTCHRCSRRGCRETVSAQEGCECGRCSNCCECIHCESCGDECSDSYCGDCNQCYECCRCERCERCERLTEDCNCQTDGLRWRSATLTPTRAPKERGTLRRMLGCELEISACDDPSALSDTIEALKCNLVEDGSVSGLGAEIVTPPRSGSLFITLIDRLGKSLSATGAIADKSCGYHVHVDAEDLGPWEMRRLIQIYARIEPALFGLVESARKVGQWCKPCGADYLAMIDGAGKDLKAKLHKGQYGADCSDRERRDKMRVHRDSSRYRALNLHTYWYRGTVEFRLHHGTTDLAKIKNWALLCGWIVERAAKMSQAQVDALPQPKTETEGRDLLISLMPKPEENSGVDLAAWIRERWEVFH